MLKAPPTPLLQGKTARWSRYKSAFTLMRIPFSVFLMPVYWFALSVLPAIPVLPAIAVFLILHLLVYPASNGFNSYHDQDEASIGGLKQPPKVTRELLYLVILFDVLAVAFSMFLSPLFAAMVALYLLVSKAYSDKSIRLKKYPILSTITVTFFQGAFTFAMVQAGLGLSLPVISQTPNSWFAAVSTLFLCGSYPLTQIYQHKADKRHGDKTLSLLLGIQGTYLFAAISLMLGTALLTWLYYSTGQVHNIWIFLLCTSPVLYFFVSWVLKSRKDADAVNYDNTMLMNKISSICISIAFIVMILINLN